MSSASYPTVTASKKSIQLDPRTKLLLLLTITTLMFSTSNEGIMNLIKPLLSLVPFILILSERRLQTAAKYLILYAACFCAGACGPDLGERAFLLCPAGGHIHHDPLCTRYHDGRLSDCVHIGERIHWSHGADAPDGEDRDPAVGDFRFFPTVSEEYQAIRDAMKMRGIRFGGKNSFLMVEYRLVPLIVSVVKIGDELSAPP